MKIVDYKNLAIKKKAKEKIGKHLCYIGLYEKCKIIIKTSLLTTAGCRPLLPVPGRVSLLARAGYVARMCELTCPAGHPARVSLALHRRLFGHS